MSAPMRISRSLSRFLTDDSGAVSVDYVVLTAAIVGLGLLMIQAVGPSAAGLTEDVSTRYETPRIKVVGGSGGEDGLNG